eukprot:6754571-Pyramimonas_sp.AAC.1
MSRAKRAATQASPWVGPPASTPVKMNASALPHLEGSSPGGASSLHVAMSAVGGGGGSVVSS